VHDFFAVAMSFLAMSWSTCYVIVLIGMGLAGMGLMAVGRRG
jgi:hypothetical protein